MGQEEGTPVVPPLGALALERGWVRPEQIQAALAEQDHARAEGRRARPLGEILIGLGALTPAQVSELVAAASKPALPPPPPAGDKPPAPKTRRAAAPSPVPFGKYTLLRELGRGGAGVVHEALDGVLNRKVALKTLRKEPGTDPAELEIEGHRFLMEARSSATLPRHPHIVGVYEAGEIDGRRYLAMELVQGKPLLQWRRGADATFEKQARLLRDVALALDHAHRHGVVHRDVKPQNILVDADGAPHLMDWGLAKVKGQGEDLALTAGGRVWGTPSHMSPEHARGLADVDHRTDVWSLGVLLYEAIAGRPPFKADTPAQLSDKVVHEPVPPLGKFVDVASLTPLQRALEPVCMKALAKDPAGRFAHAKDFADRISACLDAGATSRKRLVIGVVSTAAALLLAALAFLLLRGPDTSKDLAEADALAAKGRPQAALALYERALGADPSSERAKAGRDSARKQIQAAVDREKREAAEAARREEQEKAKLFAEELRIKEEERRRSDEASAARLREEQAKAAAAKVEADERVRAAEEARRKAEEAAKKDPAPAVPAVPAPVAPTPVVPVPAPPGPGPGPAAAPNLALLTGEPRALEAGVLHFEAEDFSGGERPAEGLDYHDNSPGNGGRAYRPQCDVDIGAHGPQQGGGFWVGNIGPGEWLHYRFRGGGRFEVEIRYSPLRQPATMHVEVDGANISGSIALPALPRGQQGTWETTKALTAPVPAGAHSLRVVFDTPTGGLDWIRLKPFVPAATPEAAKLKEAEKLVREAYKADYLRRAPAEQVALARKLLAEAQGADNDDATRFTLLSEAADVAAQGGDAALAIGAVEELERRWAVDGPALKAEALATASKAAKTPDALKAMAEAYAELAEEAVGREDYDLALTALSKSEAAGKSGQSAWLAQRAAGRSKEVTALREEHRKVKGPLKTLEEAPGDAAANLAVGLYRCFGRGEWELGLPNLAKGSDAVLAGLAQKELPAPSDPGAQAALGDAWREAAEKRTGTLKPKLQARALHWYEKALAGSTGLAKLKVEGHIEALYKVLGSESLRKGLVFWVEPGKDLQDGFREYTAGGRPNNSGATIAAAAPRALSFGPPRGGGVPATWIEYPAAEALRAVDKAGAVFAWVKTDVFDQRGGVVNRGGAGDLGDDFGLWIARGQIAAWFNYPDNRRPLNSRGTITAGQWALIGVTWDDRGAVLFIDGKEDSTHPLTPMELPQRRNKIVSIGSNPPGGHDPYLGLVGSVMIYNRPLSPVEVMQLYMGTRARFP